MILAGGRGERFGGVDKARLEVGGVRLLDRVLQAIAVDGPVILAAGNNPPPAELAGAIDVVIADLPKRVKWDQAKLKHAVEIIRTGWGDDPADYVKVKLEVSEAAFANWPRPVREIDVPWPIRLVQGTVGWTAASLAVSFVAGLATGPFAIQHFNRVSTWGLFANLAAAPISSFLMMPGLALGAALTPLGLGRAPLEVAGWAIGLINRVAEWAAAAPASQLVVPSAKTSPTLDS